METSLSLWKTNRGHYEKVLHKFSPDQLFKIPDGFSNNLIWNVGHAIAVQQLLIYRRGGQDVLIPDSLFKKYNPGTQSSEEVIEADIETLKNFVTAPIEPTIADVQANKFTTYKPFTSGAGFHIDNIEAAIEFNNYHEAIHMGYIMSIRKFL